MILNRALPAQPVTFVLFFAAVALSAWLGGLWAGLLAMVTSALMCAYYFVPHSPSYSIVAGDLPRIVPFLISASLVNIVFVRLRAETRVADERYYRLIHGVDAIVWEIDPRTKKFTFVNRRAERLLGYPVWTWLTEPDIHQRIVHPDDAARISEFWSGSIAAAGEHTADFRAMTVDRRVVWLRETIYVRHDAHGRADQITGVVLDVTDRKNESETLARVKNEFAALSRSGTALSAARNLPELTASIQTEMGASLSLVGGILCLSNTLSGELTVAESWGFELDQRYALCEAYLSQLSRSSRIRPEPWIVPALRLDHTITASELSIQEVLNIPLRNDGELQGLLVLFASAPFDLDYTRTAYYGNLGSQIALIVQKFVLYDDIASARERIPKSADTESQPPEPNGSITR